MKVFMTLFFFLLIGLYAFKFLQLLVKMKQKPVLPLTNEELQDIRKNPQTPVEFPTFSNHKTGLIIYALLLVYLSVMVWMGVFYWDIEWALYLCIFLPLIHTNNLLNLFAVLDDGLLCGTRFVHWKSIKSFQFIPIDQNHKFYGYGKEVNGGYELKIQTKFLPVSCIVTSDSMKEKLTVIMEDRSTQIERDLNHTI
ncbi:hypothetical protein [Cytobacillus gottheilii]|uniref:DUF5673 domain-containing protein n=1 Tax=Cytobacillus gottheilii TaxID=859144 RepID=A0ABX8FEE1_9BACI|nr:hypothetical protein [Cytobacillus gottheilii]QVY62379.1 hypothetical protein J1899_04555 [Cytobacillus gottheilii]